MRSSWFPVYRLLAAAASPLASRRLAKACAASPTLLARQPERHGHVPSADGELWIHAASVGELNAAEPLVRALIAGKQRIVLSTLTHTAAEQAQLRFAGCSALRHLFAPLDTVACVSRWLDHTRPRALLLVETEIWPVMLDQCRRRSIPVALVNARISGRAMRRYQRFAGLFRHALAAAEPVLCQDDASRQRFESLGVGGERLSVTGNLKFDVDAPAAPSDELPGWQRSWAGRPVWVAGSTHAGEEEIVAGAHRRLIEQHPDALLLVVPRHPERGPEALDACSRVGLNACMIDDWPDRAARAEGETGRIQAIVIDRMGVLAGLYRLVDACAVCGSLVEGTGGHNLIEPALAGKPILTGGHTADQQAAAEGLEAANGLVRVHSEIDLAGQLARILGDPEFARTLAGNATAFVESQRGALDRTLEALEPWLDEHANAPKD